MRANRGFTLLELMIVLAVLGVVASLVVWQGRSARQNASLAGGAYDLALRIGGLKARALADGRDYVLVVADASDPAGCTQKETLCGRAVVLRNPDPAFAITDFDLEPPYTLGEYVEATWLPRNAQFDLASTWRAPAPFAAVTAWDSKIKATCADGRACFALRFGADGEVRPVFPGTPEVRAGFAFVLRPIETPSLAADRRALFVSFPTGIVKTAAF